MLPQKNCLDRWILKGGTVQRRRWKLQDMESSFFKWTNSPNIWVAPPRTSSHLPWGKIITETTNNFFSFRYFPINLGPVLLVWRHKKILVPWGVSLTSMRFLSMAAIIQMNRDLPHVLGKELQPNSADCTSTCSFSTMRHCRSYCWLIDFFLKNKDYKNKNQSLLICQRVQINLYFHLYTYY